MRCKLLFLFAVFFSTNALANERACPKPSDFKEKIYNCGENRLAEENAKRCSSASLKIVRAAGAALAKAMKDLEANVSTHQQNNTLDALSRLDQSIDTLGEQISFLQERTKLVASYVSVMIDYPNSKTDEESMGCFSEHFHPIQKIVNEMDKEIINMKLAFKKAEAMAIEVSKRHENYTSVGQNPSFTKPTKTTDTPAAPTGKKIRESDISGTKPKQ
jgi:hypothetical protein